MNENQRKAVSVRNFLVMAEEMLSQAEKASASVKDASLSKEIIHLRKKTAEVKGSITTKLEDKY